MGADHLQPTWTAGFFLPIGQKTHHAFLNIYLALPFWLQILLSIGLAGIKESRRWGGTGGGREWGGGDGGVGGRKGKITLSQHYENPFARGTVGDLNQQ